MWAHLIIPFTASQPASLPAFGKKEGEEGERSSKTITRIIQRGFSDRTVDVQRFGRLVVFLGHGKEEELLTWRSPISCLCIWIWRYCVFLRRILVKISSFNRSMFRQIFNRCDLWIRNNRYWKTSYILIYTLSLLVVFLQSKKILLGSDRFVIQLRNLFRHGTTRSYMY